MRTTFCPDTAAACTTSKKFCSTAPRRATVSKSPAVERTSESVGTRIWCIRKEWVFASTVRSTGALRKHLTILCYDITEHISIYCPVCAQEEVSDFILFTLKNGIPHMNRRCTLYLFLSKAISTTTSTLAAVLKFKGK